MKEGRLGGHHAASESASVLGTTGSVTSLAGSGVFGKLFASGADFASGVDDAKLKCLSLS